MSAQPIHSVRAYFMSASATPATYQFSTFRVCTAVYSYMNGVGDGFVRTSVSLCAYVRRACGFLICVERCVVECVVLSRSRLHKRAASVRFFSIRVGGGRYFA